MLMLKLKYVSCVYLLLLGICIYAKKKGKGKGNRMYGSRDASDGQFPYAAFHLVRTGRGYGTCSGSLLTSRWVLLAAHCVNNQVATPRNHLVVAGKANLNSYLARRLRAPVQTDINENAFDLQERRAESVYYHPYYTRAGNNDVALIRVNRPFNLNSRVNIVPLSREPMGTQRVCSIAGYGIVEGDQRKHILQYINDMPARPAAGCRLQRNRDVICLADITRGICHGDSGGPIVCEGTQRGVASHGVTRGTSRCGVGVVEQYYTDTQININWIDSIMNRTTMSQRQTSAVSIVKPKDLT